jgi:hypothetical protein
MGGKWDREGCELGGNWGWGSLSGVNLPIMLVQAMPADLVGDGE